MQIKGMQAEEGSKTVEDHLATTITDKAKHDGGHDIPIKEESVLTNGNGMHDAETEVLERQSNGSRSHNSPSVDQAGQDDAAGQPLNFQLGSDVPTHGSASNYWSVPPPPSQEEVNSFHNFQPMNPQSMPNYSLNNNNSFPQPMHFGSIGQPTSYMPSNHGQFSSPPGMHGMNVVGNVGSLSGSMGGLNYQNSHHQNQRRAITAQHNFGPMGGKSMNARFPWNQPNAWPNSNQQPLSPWTMALQQQKAVNRGGGGGMTLNTKKGQSNIQPNPSQSNANGPVISQPKYGKRSSPVPNNMTGGTGMKPGYAGPSASEDSGINYHTQVCFVVNTCSIK